MQTLALVIFILVNIPLALVLYINNPKSWTNKLFAILIIVLTLYLYVNAQIYVSQPYTIRLLFSRFIMFNASFINLLVFLFLATFPLSQIPIRRGLIYLFTFVTIIISLIALLTPYIFENITVNQNNIVTPVVGKVMPLFMLHTFAFVIGGFVFLIRKYRKSTGLNRLKLRYIFFAFVLLFFFILTFNFLFPVLFNIGIFVPLLPIYILFFLILVSYSIIRHKLLDIRLVVARAVSYALLVFLTAAIYSVLILMSGAYYVNLQLTGSQFLILISLTIVIAITFYPVRRILEKYTDRILFKDQYDSNEVMSNLSRIMASTLRLEDLTHGILQELLRKVRISRAAIILLEKDLITDFKSEGYKLPPTLDEEEIKSLNKSHKTLVFEELDEGNEKQLLRKLEYSIVVFLRTEGEQVGLLVLGEKLSGDIYSVQDLKLFEILAPEAAVAIENAKAYEEIRRFNITLQEEVDRATSDLQQANEKLQELDKLKDEFVSLASHELRTPMTAIKGSLSTILEGYAGEIPKDAHEFLTAAYNENDRLIRLVNNLLNISRIEAGRFTFTVTTIDIEKLIEEVLYSLQPAVKEKNIYLKYEPDGKIPHVSGDIDKVKEVIINLVGNAIKFTHTGGVTISAKSQDKMVITAVADTGSGIAPEDQDLLFKKFSQVGKNYARPAGGTGLGLYISKRIVEGLSGKIWLESTVGKGSTFFFSLPILDGKTTNS